MSGYRILALDDLDRIAVPGNPVLRPVGRTLGVRAFGINAYTGDAPGDAVIARHREPDGQEELYAVVSGHATFAAGGEKVDAPAGTLVHVPPGTTRQAVAAEPSTTVLAVGAKTGEAFAPSGWEDFHIAEGLRRRGDLEGGRAAVREGISRDPQAWQGHYNAACFEALAGDAGAAFEHLHRALAADAGAVRERAPEDPDLDSLRDDPRYAAVIGGAGSTKPPGSAGAGSAGSGAGKANVAHLDELDAIELDDGFVWRPVRRHFGIRAFGVNAYTATESGSRIVEEHAEGPGGPEEIYLVLRGRALFTIDADEHELPAGQLAFVSDPLLKRGAVALDADTAVLAIGGKPGEPHTVSAWEAMFAAVPAARAERWDEAIRIHEEALAELPDNARLLYNLACMEARGGRHLDAMLHLQRAVSLDARFAAHARTDSDFAAIRDEPGFPS
jgi:quercetin dioxygenase-like cupin family protein